MKSKTTFTVEEYNDIIRLIEEKLKSDSEGQKAIRGKIRDKGLYWSDFYSNDTEYNVENFIRLKDEGKIFISDEADSADDLMVCWKKTAVDSRTVEKSVIMAFKEGHDGQRPFANLRDKMECRIRYPTLHIDPVSHAIDIIW